MLPDPDLFLYTYVRREAVLSSQIEGTQSSLSDLLLFELEDVPGVPLDDVVERFQLCRGTRAWPDAPSRWLSAVQSADPRGA
ncbi:Fic/DOC family N-terminal domain-containing protein [Thiomonas sp. FB-Cd]|uniref:Fic/DOC family N-terminal domain-containing protein n=1 Tax=Thiomonas sp. FB-Cd TaxID=1158292 RepID=UPI000AD97898|nr:Fic/DOC family N-terminal domain-containing protein [Thiomonas sp. FB-Cd]